MTIVLGAGSLPIEGLRAEAAPAGRLGVVTTLLAEAQCWQGRGGEAGHATFASGGDGARARDGAERLIAAGVCGLVSFGLAAGLAPVARPGDLIVAESVVLPSGQSLRADRGWRESLLTALAPASLPVRVSRVAGSERPLFTSQEKRRAFTTTFAAALDTESHAVAEAAQAAGLPFLVVRAIVDPAEVTRPFAIQAALSADGAWRGMAVALQLCLRPWEAPAVWAFGRDQRVGLARLRRVAQLMPAPAQAPATARS